MDIDALLFSPDVRRAEGSTTRLETGVRGGSLIRVRRGAYADTDEWNTLSDVGRHRLRALAFLRAAKGSVVFCRETAAVLLGIPVLGPLPDRPVVAVTPRTTCTDPGAIRCAGRLEGNEVVRVQGVTVTAPLRTAVDLGASRGPDAAVIALSDVMRRWGVTLSDIEERVRERRPFRGVRSIEAALPAASPLSETPIESLGMLRFLQFGFELPEQQVQHRVHGRLYRDDYEWSSVGVIAEADGRAKYTDDQVRWAEKIREDDLRSISRGFFRVYWTDMFDPSVFQRKARDAGVPRASRRDRPFPPKQSD